MRSKKLLQVVKFVNQWQFIPACLGFGWIVGDAIVSAKDVPIEDIQTPKIVLVIFPLWFFFSMMYQASIAFDLDRKLTKILDSIERKNTKLLEVHDRLDNLRDRLIFDSDDLYWEILEGLVIEDEAKASDFRRR